MEQTNDLQSPVAEKIDFPWLLFRLKDNYYAINTKRVTGIMDFPRETVALPNSPPYIRGIFTLRDDVLHLADLRALLGLESLEQELQEFSCMLEQRQQDHIDWVDELERCIASDADFTLATDPHKCAFGKWYDHYEPTMHSIKHHLKKIELPHKKLHEAGETYRECRREHDQCKRDKCLKIAFQDAKEVYMPQVLSILEESKQLFQQSYREMVISIEENDLQLGLVVDEVLSVEQVSLSVDNDSTNVFGTLDYITGVCKSDTIPENIFMFDDRKVLGYLAGSLMEAAETAV